MSSSELRLLFNTLPPEAQQVLVEKHLISLLDLASEEKSKEVLSAATRLQAKHSEAPKLDIRAKRKQVNALLDELARDAKTAFVKERSNQEELLVEVVHSLTSWLNDIWLNVYEYNVNFLLAHLCLAFVADTLTQLAESPGLSGCKCYALNLPIEVALKDRKGDVVKRFSVLGPQTVDRILLWIWRDLFLSIFATGSERDKKRIPDFLEDVEDALSVNALEWLLYGGRRRTDDEDASDDAVDYYDSDEDNYSDESWLDDDEVADCESYGVYDHYSRNFTTPYWPRSIKDERGTLRDCVERRLLAVFKVAPSLRLHNIILAIASDTISTSLELSHLIQQIAGDTPNNLVAALDIAIFKGEPFKIAQLLDYHSYLLRPRDAVTLQCAVSMLEDTAYKNLIVGIVEKELTGCLRAIYTNVRACFSHIEEDTHKKEMSEILKLKSSSTSRQDRVISWVENVVTPNGPIHPMAFAAMMMGLPMLPGGDDGDDGAFLNFVDMDSNDPDLEDLRDEFRPDLKGMFSGWVHLAQSFKDGPLVLSRFYQRAIEQMPWLSGSDIVSEMINKLRERPSKIHVLEALSNLSSFAKSQRKKLKSARTEQRRMTSNALSSASSRPPTTSAESTTFSSPPRSTTPPPPLIPVTPPLLTSPPSPSIAPPAPASPAVPFSFGPLPAPGNSAASLPFPLALNNSATPLAPTPPPMPGELENVD